MLVKELKEFIKDLDDNAVVSIVDEGQDNCYEISELRTCEDKTSSDYKKYVDIVIAETDEETNFNILWNLEKTYAFLTTMVYNNGNTLQAQKECMEQYNFSLKEFEYAVGGIGIHALANLYRQAENLHIDNNNGEYHGYNFTGNDMKYSVIDYLNLMFLIDDREDFYGMIESMGC